MISALNATIDSLPREGEPTEAERAEVERLVAAVKAGDRDAWRQLLYLPAPVPLLAEGIASLMPDEDLSREYIYASYED